MKCLGIFLTCFLLSSTLVAQTAVAPAVGNGTEGNPYQIASLENLYWIAASDDVVTNPDQEARWSSHYIQTADIDASATNGWFGGQGWSPIGTHSIWFTGTYNGQSYTIDGLFINRPDTNYIGLLGYTYGATIEHFGVTNVDINGSWHVGGLVGRHSWSTISNSYSTGSVSGNGHYFGGLVGYNQSSTVSNSYSTGSVSGTGNSVGGLVGLNSENSIIGHSYSTGDVSGNNYVGGLVGLNSDNSIISHSYTTGSVSGNNVGGLVGRNNQGALLHCYSTAYVTGTYSRGGLVGSIVTGGIYADTNNYWNTESSGQTSSSMGNGRSTAEMTYPYDDNTYVDWNFVETWGEDINYDINSGYPFLWRSTHPLILLSPNGGELWQGQTTKTVYWRPVLSVINVLLSIDDGISWIHMSTEPVAGTICSFSFTVPILNSDHCLIKIESAHNPDEFYDISESTFNITTSTPPSVTLTAPDTHGLKLQSYREVELTWSTYQVDNINLDISYDSGSTWHSIVEDVPAIDENFQWLVSDSPYTTCYFRVVDSDNPANYDWSSYPFTIAELQLDSPVGGDLLRSYISHTIEWTQTNLEYVNLDYSTDAGDTWSPISSFVDASIGSYNWNVPELLSNECLLRISDSEQDTIYDISTDLFSIRPQILLESPDGGETYLANTLVSILWDATDDVSHVVLDYSIDDGSNWLPIQSTPYDASDDSYTWIVPNNPTNEAKIRVVRSDDNAIYAESSSAFSIIDQIIPPAVDFSADITSGPVPLSVQFTDLSEPGVGSIISWEWDFGDGNYSEEQHPQHIYETTGVYDVSLTVTNQFNASTGLTQNDFVTVLSASPEIELLTEEQMTFGSVYVAEESEYQAVAYTNTGGVDLVVSSISFIDESQHFELLHQLRDITLEPGEIDTLYVRFTPQNVGTLADTLFIASNAVNEPLMGIRLQGTGLYVPPKAPENVQITMDGYDAVITWDPVTENEHNQPLDPDYYFVYFNGSSDPDGQYYFLQQSLDTQHIHSTVGMGADHMFYRVKAIKIYVPPTRSRDYAEQVERYLRESLKEGMTEEEVSEVLRKLFTTR